MSHSGSGRGKRPFASWRRPSKLIAVLIAIIGLAQIAFGIWVGQSNAAAEPIFRAAESCQIRWLESHASVDRAAPAADNASASSACRVEPAIVFHRSYSSSRSTRHYYLVTTAPDGSRESTQLAGSAGVQFWKRARPTERIALQRFVTPGYHWSGRVLAFTDGGGTALSTSHPDAGTHDILVDELLGSLMFLVGLAMFRTARAADLSRRISATA